MLAAALIATGAVFVFVGGLFGAGRVMTARAMRRMHLD